MSSPSSSLSASSAAPTTSYASPHLTLLPSPHNPYTSRTDSAIINAEVNSGLDLLSQAAFALDNVDASNDSPGKREEISPHILNAVTIPTVKTKKAKRRRLADELPDNYDAIRKMGLNHVKNKTFCIEKEKSKREISKAKRKS